MRTRPRDAVVICSSPRTGSGLLCSGLWSTGLCGRPDEYLDPATRDGYQLEWNCHDKRAYLERMIEHATTPNGVLSIKVHWHHLQFADSPLRSLAPQVHFFWVSRRDKLRQAISVHVANETGQYQRREGDAANPEDAISFDYHAIRRYLDEAEAGDQTWSRYFDDVGVSPIRIWYEDDLEHDYTGAVRTVLTTIGVEMSPGLTVTSDYLKQADAVSESLLRRFRAVEQLANRD